MRPFSAFVLGVVLTAASLCQAALGQTLTLESWRLDDQDIWDRHILPEFHKAHPEIQLQFKPTAPVEYDDALFQRLRKGTAGDLISCRPFDAALRLYQQDHLLGLNDVPGLNRFRAVAKAAWTTDSRDAIFCMPVASVMHGFFFNKAIFARLGLTPPETEEEFFRVLEILRKDPEQVVPIAFGTRDRWEAAQILFNGIGPNYWSGEDGRISLLNGEAKFTDAPFVDVWKTLRHLAIYLPTNYREMDGSQARNMFIQGRAAIYPSGSWEIPFLTQIDASAFGVFRPPVRSKGSACYVSNHIDMGIGINAATPHKQHARQFIDWLTTQKFAQIYANTALGYIPLSSHVVEVENHLAREMASWRKSCQTTIRINSQFLNRGQPYLESELWRVSAMVIELTLSPQDAALQIQTGVEQWYLPR